MIQAGEYKIEIKRDGPSHARLRVLKDMPPGHLPRKIVDLAVDRELLIAELKAAKIIE